MDSRFQWTNTYMEIATALLPYKTKQKELLNFLYTMFDEMGTNNYLQDKQIGTGVNFEKIDPFTVMGIFNRNNTTTNRITIINHFINFLNIDVEAPANYDGVPILNPMLSWFFGENTYDRNTHIDNIWDLFETGIKLADTPSAEMEEQFAELFDFIISQPCSEWMTTIGLFWIRPYFFITLDDHTRKYLNNNLSIEYNLNKIPSGKKYLDICADIKTKLSMRNISSSFPELSYAAWTSKDDISLEDDFKEWMSKQPNKDNEPYRESTLRSNPRALKEACKGLKDLQLTSSNLFHYSDAREFIELEKKIRASEFFKDVNDKKMYNGFLSSGMSLYKRFLSEREAPTNTNSNVEDKTDNIINNKTDNTVEDTLKYSSNDFLTEVYMTEEKHKDIITLLERKKNIILQGAPGVGKSYLAKRLAYSILGLKDASKVEMVQFHQSYSYEDFIEGFRPAENGHFEIRQGVFFRFCQRAKDDKKNKYFFIIDEINRGNISKIMGELMFLIEHDKRGEEFSIPLTYSDKRFCVPENVYIIGMMNTADRSLAMIDYALRRRFSFVQIEPAFENERFIADFRKNYTDANIIIEKIKELNALIKAELDEGHQIGHSYFCSDKSFSKNDIDGIIKYEITELLKEYFFDNESKLDEALNLL